MERRIAEIPASEWDDLSIDLTPREHVLDFLEHAFPVQLQEPFEDDDGNLMSRPVFDAHNSPVLCQEALAKRDVLIQKLGALPPVQSALDQIIHRFGHDAVAEITGRSRRVLRIMDARGERLDTALPARRRPTSPRPPPSWTARSASLCSRWRAASGAATTPILAVANTQRRIHLSAGAGLADRPGDPGARPDPQNPPGVRAALPPRRYRREGRAQVHRHHRPAPRQFGRHHAGPERCPDRHGRRRHRAVPGQRQPRKPLRQVGVAPVLHRALARPHRGLVPQGF